MTRMGFSLETPYVYVILLGNSITLCIQKLDGYNMQQQLNSTSFGGNAMKSVLVAIFSSVFARASKP